MANKFILWCEDENATQDYNTFLADNQRRIRRLKWHIKF